MNKENIKQFFNDEVIQLISETLNDRNLPNQFTENRSSTINIWIKEGLIDDDRNGAITWKQHSIIEILWIEMINRLRGFGYSREKIRKVKEQLLIHIQEVNSPYPFFEFHIIRSAIYKKPYYILIGEEGEMNILSYDNYLSVLQNEDTPEHLVMSLNKLFLKQIIKIESSKWSFEELFKRSREELELLGFIQKNDFTEVNIVMLNGNIERLEGKEKISTKKRITEILKESAYQDIEVKQENNRVVYITRKVKKKIKK